MVGGVWERMGYFFLVDGGGGGLAADGLFVGGWWELVGCGSGWVIFLELTQSIYSLCTGKQYNIQHGMTRKGKTCGF